METNRKGQEEMVGFALIVILVAVILVVFLGFSLNKEKESVQSYEVESFLQASLQYTTSCSDNFEYLSLQDLIFNCAEENTCSEGKNSCEVLEMELKGILGQSWTVKEGSITRGYEMNMTSNGKEIIFIAEGNSTGNSKGSFQNFFRTGNSIDILFTVYS